MSVTRSTVEHACKGFIERVEAVVERVEVGKVCSQVLDIVGNLGEERREMDERAVGDIAGATAGSRERAERATRRSTLERGRRLRPASGSARC